MSGDLTDPLWGTGYGSKRHLVDMATLHRAAGVKALSRCSSRTYPTGLDFLGDDTATRAYLGYIPAELVASRPPCARCLKIAEKEAQA